MNEDAVSALRAQPIAYPGLMSVIRRLVIYIVMVRLGLVNVISYAGIKERTRIVRGLVSVRGLCGTLA